MTATITADAPATTATAAAELNPEHFTPRGLIIAQIAQDAETFRQWLSEVRVYVIEERRQSRASYCSSGLDEFLTRHNLPGRAATREVGSQLISYVPEHYSVAGLRKKRIEQQERFDAIKQDIRTDAVNAHVSGYATEERLREFVRRFGLGEVTSRETWAFNTESMSVAFPPGSPLATHDSDVFARELKRLFEKAVTDAGGTVVSRPRVYASYTGSRAS